jgi:hypothetical protein
LNPRLTDRAVVTHSQLSPFANDETAASRRGLAYERAHFTPDTLNGDSPDADGRSSLVDARAAPQKPLDCPFRRAQVAELVLGVLAFVLSRHPGIDCNAHDCLAGVVETVSLGAAQKTADRISRGISMVVKAKNPRVFCIATTCPSSCGFGCGAGGFD